MSICGFKEISGNIRQQASCIRAAEMALSAKNDDKDEDKSNLKALLYPDFARAQLTGSNTSHRNLNEHGSCGRLQTGLD
jgi:hypothetical protein